MFRSYRDVTVPKVVAKQNDEKQVYGCSDCSDGGWTSETEVEIHKNRKHFKGSFYHIRKKDDICCICTAKCADKEAVVRHIKTEHLLSTENSLRVEREIFICDKCSAIFFNKDNLALHFRYAHFKAHHLKYLRCPLCSKRILQKTIPSHFYMHNIRSVSTCRICLTKLRNTKELRRHLETHPLYLKCSMCYFDTHRPDQFQKHIRLRHRNMNGTSEDYERFFIPKRPSYLKLQQVAGVRGIRLSNDVHICVLCREICVSDEEMKTHITEHSFKQEVVISYVCPVCLESFSNKVLLKYHMFKMKHDFGTEKSDDPTNQNTTAQETEMQCILNPGPSTSSRDAATSGEVE